MNQPSKAALEFAAQCWCDKETEMITMDSRLATAFAKRLDIQFGDVDIFAKEVDRLAQENKLIKIKSLGAFNNIDRTVMSFTCGMVFVLWGLKLAEIGGFL